MIVARTIAQLREALAPHHRANATVGLVPTMGALHAGHLELVHRAGIDNAVVVLSIFVNPTQFNDQGDLAAYPRTEKADLQAAERAGVDIAFVPSAAEVYPAGFRANVSLRGPLVETLEGAHRGAGHFDGVTTVVAKLFNLVGPDRAYFGEKDAQQLRVVTAMASDLDFPVRIVPVPTVREADGLALSSRNVRLTAGDRVRALALVSALRSAEGLFHTGETDATTLIARAHKELVEAGITPEYVALLDDVTFLAVETVVAPAVLAVAAMVGPVRLIDNLVLRPR